MTAKERAFELVDKMVIEISESDFHVPEFITGVPMADGTPEYTTVLEEETKSLAKQCALIAVEEIINAIAIIEKDYHEGYFSSDKNEWQQVKSEIEKL